MHPKHSVSLYKKETLKNGFQQYTLQAKTTFCPPPEPGQQIRVAAESFYILGSHLDTISFLVPPENADLPIHVHSKDIQIEGTPLPPPLPSQFCLFIIPVEGLAALLFYLKKYKSRFHGIAFIDTPDSFPFAPCPSRQLIYGLPAEVIAALPLLEDWGIPHRLASLRAQPGCFHGTAEALAHEWAKNTNQTLPSPLLGENKIRYVTIAT